MLRDITLGQYFPRNSLLHRADPRTKILLVTAIIVVLFVCNTAASYAVLAAYIIGLIYTAKLRIRMVLRGLRPIMIILILTAVLNLFSTGGSTVLWRFGVLSITQEGIYRAALMTSRLILLIAAASLLTYTTSPIQLTDGLERLFAPLKRLHVPVHELAMMMSLALRFIPTLVEETNKIMNAQRARGADFETGGMLRRARALIPILVPLFVSSFRRADELATAMECRLYRGDTGRTRLHQLKFGRADIICAISAVLLLGFALALRFIGI